MSLVGLLVLVIILGLILYLVQLLPLPAPFKMIAQAIVILVAIVWLAEGIGLFSGGTLRIR